MQAPFWNDEDRPFIFWGLGLSFNFKWAARRLGLIKRPAAAPDDAPDATPGSAVSSADRLREQIESSKYEERR